MEFLKKFLNWFSTLNRRGKALVVIGGATVVFFILEALK